MKKTKINIFFESKLVFAKRKEGELWEEEKRDEKGMGVSESVISEFEEYYRPNNLEAAIEHPDEIVHGVRDRMMQGPLGARNILSGGSILERRVLSSLETVASDAPRLYRQMINEAIRYGAPPLEVARNMFTYDIDAGGSYYDLLTDLQAEIMALGYIGPPTFVDSRGQRINLANPAQTNEFDVVAGAPGIPGNVTVVIRWHQEDLTTIIQKLEQAGMWADFSRQGGAREFLHLKFRQSLIQRTVWKEKTKLSKDKFDPQRLKSWLDDELHARALADPEYVTWFGGWSGNTATSMAALTPAQRNELTRAQREARERVQEQSLEAKLKKILIPGEIENVTKSLETKTMLAYLFYKMSQSNEDRENVENFIDELAGVDYEGNIETLGSIGEKSNEFIDQIRSKMVGRDVKAAESANLETRIGEKSGPGGAPPATGLNLEIETIEKEANDTIGAQATGTPATGLYLEIETIEKKINNSGTGLQARLEAEVKRQSTPGLLSKEEYKKASTDIAYLTKQIEISESKIESIKNRIFTIKRESRNEIRSIKDKIDALQKEKALIDKEIANFDAEIFEITKNYESIINQQANNSVIWGNSIKVVSSLRTRLRTVNNRKLSNSKRIAELKALLNSKKIGKITSIIDQRKTHFENLQKNRPGAAGKMDSRGLLYKLTKRDLELKGVTADPHLENEALITTNILIAQARNQEIYGNVNQSIARRIEHGGNEDEWVASRFFFSPVMTGVEAMEHVCDTDSDLNKLRGLNINSTPAHIIRIMQDNKMVSAVKLRELQKKLSELLRGVIVDEKEVKIMDRDANQVEKFINNLVLVESRLNAESRLQEVSEGFYDTSKGREEQVLQMLQNQTSDSVDTDSRIAEDLESHDAKFKRFFLKNELSQEFNAATEELEGLPKKEVEEELRRRGLTARVRSRGVLSLRATRFLRRAGLTLLRHNLLVWVVYDGLFKSGRRFYGYAKSILWTDIAKQRAEKVRQRYKGSIIEPISTVAIAWPLAIGSYVISRPKTWMRKISDWGSKKAG